MLAGVCDCCGIVAFLLMSTHSPAATHLASNVGSTLPILVLAVSPVALITLSRYSLPIGHQFGQFTCTFRYCSRVESPVIPVLVLPDCLAFISFACAESPVCISGKT